MTDEPKPMFPDFGDEHLLTDAMERMMKEAALALDSQYILVGKTMLADGSLVGFIVHHDNRELSVVSLTPEEFYQPATAHPTTHPTNPAPHSPEKP